MSSYSTEIRVPADRRLFLYLPDDFPIGCARLIVEPIAEADDAPITQERPALDGRIVFPPEFDQANDPCRQDVEWWEEFEEDE